MDNHNGSQSQEPNQDLIAPNGDSLWYFFIRAFAVYLERTKRQTEGRNREMEERTRHCNDEANQYRNLLVTDGSSSQVHVAASGENSAMSEGIQQLVLVERPNVRWDDVIGHDHAKEALHNAVVMPLKHPHLFENNHLKPIKNILFYGPPGCGKTELARAVATEAEGHKFFLMSASDIFSKYVGDPEKKVAEIFVAAEKNGPAIIFMDEIDAICRSRGDDQSAVDRRVLTEVLNRLDGIRTRSQSGLVFIGATNVPWDLDDAMCRRFQEMVFVGLPDAEARENLFKLHLRDIPNTLTESDFKDLGDNSGNFSGSDIKAIADIATRGPVRKARSSRHFKQVNDGSFSGYLACDENEAGAVKMSFDQVPEGKLAVHRVTIDDVKNVILGRKASVSTTLLDKLDKFHENRGH